MMFLLVAIIFMVKAEAQQRNAEAQQKRAEEETIRIKDIALLYDQMREQLYRDLESEFKDDLKRWRATLDHDLAIRFEEPDVLFRTGKADLSPQFKNILEDFFPRYVRILSSDRYKSSIEEIRIEGHTSSFWSNASNNDAYFLNMELSQSRTRSTLEYVLAIPKIAMNRQWLISRLTANGLSSSRLRFNPDGTENREASQRVEFRVRTNADAKIGEILRAASQ